MYKIIFVNLRESEINKILENCKKKLIILLHERNLFVKYNVQEIMRET